MDILHDTVFLFDIIGAIAFGLSGAIVAIKSEMDISGVIFLSFVTGCGGGTIRDLILRAPVFWTQNIETILLSIVPGALFFLAYSHKYFRSRWFNRILAVFDTAGLAAFTVGGVSKAFLFGQNWLVAIMMGALTAVGGGILRDLFCSRIPSVFRSMFYLTPVVIGAVCYVLLQRYVNAIYAASACLISVILLRFFGEYFHWQLPRK